MDFFLTNEYIGLYFFSAVFQGNMALLALAGVFAVYRIQSLDGQIATQTMNLFEYFAQRSWTLDYREMRRHISDISTATQLQDRLKQWKKSDPPTTSHSLTHLRSVAVEVLKEKENDFIIACALETKRTETVEQIKQPFVLTLATILVSLVSLPFAHVLHKNYITIEAVAILITIILQLVSLLSTSRFIFAAIRTESDNKATE